VGLGFLFLVLAPTLGTDILAAFAVVCLEIALLVFFARTLGQDDEFGFLATLCVCAFLLRVILSFALHSFDSFFALDPGSYERQALSLVHQWKSGQSGSAMRYGGYSPVVAAIYFIFGYTPIGAKVVNGFLGTLTAVLIYSIAREVYGRRVARIASLLSAFFPSLVLWSSLILKDAMAVFLIVLAIWSTVKLHSRFRIRYIIVLLASVVYYTQIRWFLVPYIIAAILASFLIQPMRGLIRNISVVAMVLLLLIAVWQYIPERTKERYSNYSVDLAAINEVRGKFATGGSEFLGHVTIDSYTEALRFLPVGLFYFFLGPLPWQSHGLRQMITIPEVLMWYCLIPFMIYGFLYVLKNVAARSCVIIIYVALLTLAYSFGITNFGALFRYRSQLLVFYFIFAAVGIARWIAKSRFSG
jgi:4-amino-4-deoxy-L-arabinose transferase-like glycosyltransferase